jgi:hypothetical protein
VATPTSVDPIPSLAERLAADLGAFVEQMDDFLDASEIQYEPHPRNSGYVILDWHDYHWGPVDDRHRQMQRSLLEAWQPWMEQLRLLLSSDSSTTKKQLNEVDAFVRRWIDRDGAFDFSIPRSIPDAKQRLREQVAVCSDLLRSLDASQSETIVLPRQQHAHQEPGHRHLRPRAGQPEVHRGASSGHAGRAGQAEDHPQQRHGPGEGAQVQWAHQGLAHARQPGPRVKVQGDVWVRAEGREPNFSATLSWLDPNVADDRLLASVFEIQRRHPTSRVVLLTGDVNLLAKADTARIPTADTPDPEPE